MSLADKRKEPEQLLRFNYDGGVGLQFKCGGHGEWLSFTKASPLKAGDAYICTDCADGLLTELERRTTNART